MPLAQTNATTCTTCGAQIDTTEGIGCMVCLLRVGLDSAPADDNPDSPFSNDLFGPYKIAHRDDGSLWELGRGAMGVTFRAIDASLERPVALKIIQADLGGRGAEARERFMREARAAAGLRHPNIATVYHFGIREETGQCFYAMELVEGETLDARVRRLGPLEVETTIEIARQVTDALGAAEKNRLVHRDLKPANLMIVGKEGDGEASNPGDVTVKVIDFGVAKALAETTDPSTLTRGGFIGTPAFASPEQFTNAPVDVRSDIYSLGATLCYLLTGQLPFGARSVEESRERPHLRAVPLERLRGARVPARLISLLGAMLAREPAARPGVRELTERLQQCRAQLLDRWRKPRRIAMAAALIAAAAAAVFLLSWPAQMSAVPEKSIAVLPFENMSDDKANAFFATGMQDEILTHLAKIADLKVISRTSVMSYNAGAGRNLREIGKQLGVAHLLEGSVQRDANRVRVNVQLIDARTDVHLWAQTYDRDLADVFAIQSEIAKTIADQLQAKFSPAEKRAIEERPTADLAAFDLYTHAKSLQTINASVQGKNNRLQAIGLLNQAVTRDPEFLLAWCELALTHDLIYFYGEDHTPRRLALGDAAVERALRLRPDAGEAHLASAHHLYQGRLDYDQARAELAIAQRTLPNEPSIFNLAGNMDRRQGRWVESTRNLERVVELDPRNASALQNLSSNYELLRRYADAAAVTDTAVAVAPKSVDTRTDRAVIDLNWRADPRPLRATINAILAEDPAATPALADTSLNLALCERDPTAVAKALAALSGTTRGTENPNFVAGLMARVRGDAGAARAAFTLARAQQEELTRAQPSYAPALAVLALIDAALGRKEEALREGRRALELLPVTQDAIDGALMIQFFATVCAWVGETDLALEQLTIAAKIPGDLSYGQLKLHPFWDPLRGDARFEALVASLAPR